MRFLLPLLSLALQLSAQPVDPAVMRSSGPCSPNIAVNTGEVRITCTGVFGPKALEKVEAATTLLNRALASSENQHAEVMQMLDQIANQLVGVEAKIGQTRLRAESKTRLIQLLGAVPAEERIRVVVDAEMSSGRMGYAEDLRIAFATAGWDAGNGVNRSMWTAAKYGVEVQISPSYNEETIPPVYKKLVNILLQAGVMDERALALSEGIKPNEVTILVGNAR